MKKHVLILFSYPCWWVGKKNEVVIKWRWEIVINKDNRKNKSSYFKLSLEWSKDDHMKDF